ncbi:MAG: HD domain-containing protein [Oscillospiraceae bacterium]|nr:HD domain-containing protein [Oscillospiraceae bacterium]
MDFRIIREENEKYLSKYAARSANSLGRLMFEEKCPVRTDYERDHNRILYSVDFRRLRHKTQVFFNAKNDHICTRMEHVLYVGAIASTITRTLNLNQDLAYAVALGHDLGHAPFGHTGERVLDECVRKINKNMSFRHEQHSLRVVDRLAARISSGSSFFGSREQRATSSTHRGLNLTFEVRDGIACHCGENYNEHSVAVDWGKRPDRLMDNDIQAQNPATMEACVVRLVDKIAYVGRDIEDAVRAGIIGLGDISKDVLDELGYTNGQIINTLVCDIIENSMDRDYIALSKERGEALERLINENVRMIYKSRHIIEYERSMSNTMEGLFNGLNYSLSKGAASLKRADEKVLRMFGNYIDDQGYSPDDPPEQMVLDFVAGMTDSFALQCYEEIYWV